MQEKKVIVISITYLGSIAIAPFAKDLITNKTNQV